MIKHWYNAVNGNRLICLSDEKRLYAEKYFQILNQCKKIFKKGYHEIYFFVAENIEKYGIINKNFI